jgi:3-dehydroquinate dehydratase-2
MHIEIINGPNLNLLGLREPEIYGSDNFVTYLEKLKQKYPQIELTYFQSNIEGEIINQVHKIGFLIQGIILNAGAYTHTSLAIADAIAAIPVPVIEVHISNIFAREEIRQHSMIAANCRGTIGGFGLLSYPLAIEAFLMLGLPGLKLS